MQFENIIEVKDLQVSYLDKTAITNINLDIPKGVRCAIVGPNGAGKSTLLKAILNLISRDHGQVNVIGKDISKVSKQIAYVPQKGSVNWDFPITVFDVVMMGRYAHLPIGRKPSKEDEKFVIDSLKEMGMLEFRDRQISQLSGGQKQRVFLARALAQNVDVYILDEPLTGVDINTEKIIAQKFKELQDKGKTIIAVHHNLFTLDEYFDYLVVMNQTVKVVGPLDEVNTQENIDLAFRS